MGIVADLAVAGLMLGTLYGLVAVTLTLMLRSSGVLSFAHAGFALIAAYLYAGFECPRSTDSLRQCGEPLMPPAAAAVVAVLAAVAAALVVEWCVARPLERAPAATKVIATAAVLGLVSGVLLQVYGPQPRSVPEASQILPGGSFVVAGVVVNWARFTIFVVSAALVGLLGLFLRRSWFGLGVRAAGQRPDVARLMGVSPVAVGRFNWALGGFLAGLAGVLIGPVSVVNISTFSFLLVKAVGASLIGGLVSLPLSFAGGLGIGVTETLVPHWWKTPGAASVAIAGLVLGMLLVHGKRFAVLVDAGTERSPSGRTIRVANLARWICGVRRMAGRVPPPLWRLAAVAVLIGPMVNPYYASIGVSSLYYCLIALSILVFTGTTGQLTFMQAGFAAVGAFGLATALAQGWAVVPAMAATTAVCVFTGLLAGRMSLRFRGLEFAIASITLGAVLSEFAVTRHGVATSLAAPELFGRSLIDSRNLYGFMLVVTALAMILVRNLRRSGWGVALTAMREMHTRVAHFGISPVRGESALLAVSAALAGLSGCVLALTVISLDPVLFVPILSVTMVLAAVVGGLGTLWGPVLAGLTFGVGQEVVGRLFSGQAANAFPQIAGAALALVLVVWAPGGLASLASWAEEVAASAPIRNGLAFRGRELRWSAGGGAARPDRRAVRLNRDRAGRRLARPAPVAPRRLGRERTCV